MIHNDAVKIFIALGNDSKPDIIAKHRINVSLQLRDMPYVISMKTHFYNLLGNAQKEFRLRKVHQ